MEINLKDTLKALRRQKNVTQEALAEHLGITQQSVGKWERGEGYPDITMLPNLALYFDISIDDLLNVGQARIDDKLEAYKSEAVRLAKLGENNERIALWEKAHMEFPNNHFVMTELLRAILCKGKWPIPDEDAERVIQLGTRVLEESTDSKLREQAISELCSVYKSRGETEKALSYADMAGSIFNCREGLRAGVLEGEEGIRESQEYILFLVYLAMLETINLSGKGLPPEREVVTIQFGIDLLKLLIPDGNYGGYAHDMAYLYFCLARMHAWQQNAKESLNALEACVTYCIMHAKKREGKFTAPMIDRLEYGKNFSKNYKGNSCNLFVKRLLWNCFDFIRQTPKFKEMEALLKQNAEEI